MPNSTPSSSSPSEQPNGGDHCKSFQVFLTSELDAITSDRKHKRSWTFDMDDQPELDSGLLNHFPKLVQTLQFLRDTINPVWESADLLSMKNQKTRNWVTWFAIWPGIAAIVLAILQLAISHIAPQLTETVTLMEIAMVILAAIAVVQGVRLRWQHRWLTCRQSAERLRSLKFQALGWHEIWCDEEAWKKRVLDKANTLSNLTDHEAENWATREDDATPATVSDRQCTAEPNELRALAVYYRCKRLKYQQAYFDRQSRKADSGSWPVRWRVSLCAFFISVVAVLFHGILASIFFFGQAAQTAKVSPGETYEKSEAAQTSDPDVGKSNSDTPDPASAEHKSEAVESKSASEIQSHDGDEIGPSPATGHSAEGEHYNPYHKLEIILVGLAALIPVLAFGIRAWTSAFEYPRSRNLFRAKSYALNEPVELIEKDSGDLKKTMGHISFSEHFLLGEHREWCRLQLESEWYV